MEKLIKRDDIQKSAADLLSLFYPSGTLDSTASEDFKDSKYGSSSTMSVGSDASPATERRNQHKTTKLKLNKPQVTINLTLCTRSLASQTTMQKLP